MIFGKEVVQYLDKLYYVYRKVKPDRIKEGYINDVKEFWHCDLVLRNKYNNDDTLLFLKSIDDAEIVKDII